VPADNVRANVVFSALAPLEHCGGCMRRSTVLDMDLAGAQHSAINCQPRSNSHWASRVIQSLGLTVWARLAIILTSTTH
jgi:hypothetical protein